MEDFPGIVTILIISVGKSAFTRASPMYSSAQLKVVSSQVAVLNGARFLVTCQTEFHRTLSAVKARGRMKEESSRPQE